MRYHYFTYPITDNVNRALTPFFDGEAQSLSLLRKLFAICLTIDVRNSFRVSMTR